MLPPDHNDKLVFAAMAGNYRVLRERVEAGADVNHIHPKRGTAIFAAAGHAQCVAYLLSKGADPNLYTDPDGSTTLDRALQSSGAAESALLLHRSGARASKCQVLPPPTSTPWVVGTLVVCGHQHMRRMVTRGQVSFGRVHQTDRRWVFDWAMNDGSGGHLFRLEALSLPEHSDIYRVEQIEYQFEAVDYQERRYRFAPKNHDFEIDAVVSIY